MSNIECRVCFKEVDVRALVCPYCSARNPGRDDTRKGILKDLKNRLGLIIIGIIVISVGSILFK